MSLKVQEMQDLEDMALKLDKIRVCYPEDFFYLKGWINGRLYKEEKENIRKGEW